MIALLCCLLTALPTPAPQQLAQEDAGDVALAEAFAELDPLDQAAVLQACRRRLRLQPQPALDRVREVVAGERPAPLGQSALPRDPKTTLKQVYERGSGAHRSMLEAYATPSVAPGLAGRHRFDWHSWRVVRATEPVSPTRAFESLLAGWPPEADHILARATAELAANSGLQKSAHWFGYLFVDPQGTGFEGISHYQVWRSGQPLAIAEGEATRFAEEVLGRSIPPDDALLSSIAKEAIRYHAHRRRIEIAALAVLRDAADLDPIDEQVHLRMHYLLAAGKDDLRAVGRRLARQQASELIRDVDLELEDPENNGLRLARLEELRQLRKHVRRVAVEEFTAHTESPPTGR